MLTLKLPWPPSVNHYKKAGRLITTKSGKIFQPRVNTIETNQYFFEVWKIIYDLKAKEGLKSFGSATISVEVDAYPPNARKRDLDNICKVLLDSLVHAKLIDDDSQIARLVLQRMSIIPKGQLILRIKEHGNGHA